MKVLFEARAIPRALIGAAVAVAALSAGVAAVAAFDRPEPEPARLSLAATATLPEPAAPPTPAVKVGPPARISLASVQPAASFDSRSATRRDLECLTAAVYYEARGESAAGQAAVAQVIINRVADPRFPKSVCAVVYQGAGGRGCQFSFACDGVIDHGRGGAAWTQARRVAERALSGFVMDEVGNATHFHATRVSPNWGAGLRQVAQIGLHVFYRSARSGGTYAAPRRAPAIEAPAPEPVQLASLTVKPVKPLIVAPTLETPALSAGDSLSTEPETAKSGASIDVAKVATPVATTAAAVSTTASSGSARAAGST